MSSLRWKVKRLLAMSPGEVVARLARAIRERVHPLPKETPEQTWRRYYPNCGVGSALHGFHERLRLYPDALSDAERVRVVQEADALLRGAWTLFGYPVQLDDPPVWNRNYLLGKDWMDAPSKAIDYRRIDVAGGVKYVWEPSRGQPLLRLATAYALTGDTRYAATCRRWLLDWIERNPRGWGIHWTSALEHAIRVFAWSYALALLHDALSEADALKILGALIQHGEFIERHLSPGSSANNHLIGEAAALAFLGNLLPHSALAMRWRERGGAILQREAVRQFYPDGVNAEQAFGYLPFVWEFYLHVYRLQAMPNTVATRLQRSIEFVRNVMDASGYVPQVGDEDDGTVAPFWSGAADRHRGVGRALARLLGCEPPPAFSDADDALCLWLWGDAPAGGSRLTEPRLYPDGGYAVLHSEHWQVLFDAGALGLGSLAAHGHADALSVWASLDGKPLLIDAGTYAYHEDPDWRNHFRSTPAHNTLALDSRNQSEIQGPFLWGKKARAEFVQCDLRQRSVTGRTDAFAPNLVQRRVQVQHNILTVRDTLEHDGAQLVRWYWHFHPEWRVEPANEGVWRIADGERICTLRLIAPAPYEARLYCGDEATRLGWYSPRFGHKVPCTTLTVEMRALSDALEREGVVWEFRGER
ncbi:MAG: heparinase II/III family protein [Fimbriimonadales bacterium]|nr:heparinase II/III family protein [Fimbriimonadales bacterium]